MSGGSTRRTEKAPTQCLTSMVECQIPQLRFRAYYVPRTSGNNGRERGQAAGSSTVPNER